MPEILASALHEKPVLSTDGRELGTVFDIFLRLKTEESRLQLGRRSQLARCPVYS